MARNCALASCAAACPGIWIISPLGLSAAGTAADIVLPGRRFAATEPGPPGHGTGPTHRDHRRCGEEVVVDGPAPMSSRGLE